MQQNVLKRQNIGLLNQLFIKLLIILYVLNLVQSWCLKTKITDTSSINAIDYSSDGSLIVTGSNNRLIIWDAHKLQHIKVIDYSFPIYSVKFSKDVSRLAIGGQSSIVFIYNVANYANVSVTTNLSKVWEVDLDNSKFLATCGQTSGGNGKVQTWRFTGMGVASPNFANDHSPSNPVLACKYAKFNNRIAYADKSAFTYVVTYDQTSGVLNTLTSALTSSDRNGQHKALDWNDITGHYYVGGTDKKIYDMRHSVSSATLTQMSGVIGTNQKILTITVTQDGQYAVFAGQDGQALIYNVSSPNSQTKTQTIKDTDANLMSSAFSSDSIYMVIGDDSGTIYVYKRTCSGCPAGTYFNFTQCRLCRTDIPGCLTCRNSSYCDSCFAGYYLDTSTNLCKNCSDNLNKYCYLCQSATKCTLCLQQYYVDASGVCKQCYLIIPGCINCHNSTHCLTCENKFYLNASTNKCVSCSQNKSLNCLVCNSSTYCLECGQGFYQDNGSCINCSTNCTNCINASYCTQCDNGFYLSNGVCAQCTVKNCLMCNSSNFCFDCIEGMYETSTGTCEFCKPPCLQCTSSATSCQACVVGFYRVSPSTCTACATIKQGCLSCKGPSASDCQSCMVGYYLESVIGGSCAPCRNLLTNCAECTATLCVKCKIGYYYNASTNVCDLCSKGCYTCNNKVQCLSCEVGYYHSLSGSTCTACPASCTSCNNSTVCISCNPTYYYNSTNNNCTKCSITNCLTCSAQNVCLICAQKYFVDNNGALCRPCYTNLTNCQSCYNQSYCKTCAIGYFLATGNGSCTKCTSPCTSCNIATDCFTCQLGYYLDITNATARKCISCPKQCSQCVSSTNCTSCIPNYYQNSTTSTCKNCDLLQTGCLICTQTECLSCKYQLGYFYNFTSKKCVTCSLKLSNCLWCKDQTQCLECQYGYFFILNGTKTQCQRCNIQILNCDNCLNSTKCQTCLHGYYSQVINATHTTCSPCSFGCLFCNSSSICSKCMRQYVLETNNSCKICEEHLLGCEECNYSPTIKCTNCIDGYYLTTSTCTLCETTLEGCNICNDSSICVTCKSGYYKNITTNKCILCPKNCELCLADTVNASRVICKQCNEGYFLNISTSPTINECQTCSDLNCARCLNSSDCLRCNMGYYLSSSTKKCVKCQNLFAGCITCNQMICFTCETGFYLNSTANKCTSCFIKGCQICQPTATSLSTNKCLACNSQHYLLTSITNSTINNTCKLCFQSLPHCLECSSETACTFCDSSYYIALNKSCSLCQQKFTGCQICTPSLCLQCDSGYLINSSNLCQACSQYIPGCSFCLDSTICDSCFGGYFLQSNQCKTCGNIIGCLECKNSTYCVFCEYGFYLAANGTCNPCSIIGNCINCVSNNICTNCLGNFVVSAGSCVQLKSKSFLDYSQVKFITQYVSDSILKSTLMSIGKKIVQIDLQWKSESNLYIIDDKYQQHKLTIQKILFTQYSIIFYTDNPLTALVDLNNMNKMPLFDSIGKTQKKSKRLLVDSLQIPLKSKLQMSQLGFNTLFPTIQHSGSYNTKYSLSQPQFYRSLIKNQTYYYHYFGYLIIISLIILYFLKTFFIVPQTDDKGEIVPHILCVKAMAFIAYPLYGEYLDYCQGFMAIDFPWLNDILSKQLTVSSDISPDTYKLFYQNLNFPSTYLLALGVFIFIFVSTFAILKYLCDNLKLWTNFRQYLSNIFVCGLIYATSLSLQGAYYNRTTLITVNSLFYILGIVIYFIFLSDMAYSIYNALQEQKKQKIPEFQKYTKKVQRKQMKQRKTIPFHKFRIICKITGLSLTYINPIYILLVVVFLDICMLMIEYMLKKERKIAPKTWFINNILVNFALSLMMIGPYSLISIFLTSFFILLVIGLQIWILIKQKAELQNIEKVKLNQTQIQHTISALQYNKRFKFEQDQIYFKNKIMEQPSQINNLSEESNIHEQGIQGQSENNQNQRIDLNDQQQKNNINDINQNNSGLIFQERQSDKRQIFNKESFKRQKVEERSRYDKSGRIIQQKKYQTINAKGRKYDTNDNFYNAKKKRNQSLLLTKPKIQPSHPKIQEDPDRVQTFILREFN